MKVIKLKKRRSTKQSGPQLGDRVAYRNKLGQIREIRGGVVVVDVIKRIVGGRPIFGPRERWPITKIRTVVTSEMLEWAHR